MHEHHMHGGWGNPRWDWGGDPFRGRRAGYPLFGGFGMGGGMGGGLLGDLLAGGVGYLVGKNNAQNQQQYPPQYQQYPPQYQQVPPQYQQPSPQYQTPYAQGSGSSVQDSRLAQLNLLGRLRAQGTLTEDEFQAEKQRILNGY